jgi:chromosome segregation ATPase
MPLIPDLTQDFVRDFQKLAGELEMLRQHKPVVDPSVSAARDEALAQLANQQRQNDGLQSEIGLLKKQLEDAASRQPATCTKCERFERDLQAARQQVDDLSQEVERWKTKANLPKGDTKALEEKTRSLQVELEEQQAEVNRLEEKIIELEQDLWNFRQGKSKR